jgi:hypothetical protein
MNRRSIFLRCLPTLYSSDAVRVVETSDSVSVTIWLAPELLRRKVFVFFFFQLADGTTWPVLF